MPHADYLWKMSTTNLFPILLLFTLPCFSQEWKSATPPPGFLTDHTFGFSIDDKGYLVSGTTEFNGPTKAFLRFDPETDTWDTLEEFPGLARGYGIGDVWDRKAYFGFGTSPDSLLRDLWVFDPDSMQWTELTSCPCAPRLHPTFVANKGKIFVGLGNNNDGNLTDWWEYDIPSDAWSQKPDYPDTRRHHPYQFAIGDYVYTAFGHGNGIFRELYRYDPVLEEWQRMADIPGEGRVAGTQFSYAGKGYVLSGDGDDHLSMETGEMWRYDPLLNTWDSLPPHPGKSRWAPASFVIDGVAYLYNGTSYFKGTGFVYQAEAYSFDLKEMVSSAADLSISSSFTLYPNPFSSSFYIKALEEDYQQLSIYTMDNKLVYTSAYSTQHDVSHLPAGLYRIEIHTDDTIEVMLGVKQ
jgi:N-acetylneuraminic acid mutarotase